MTLDEAKNATQNMFTEDETGQQQLVPEQAEQQPAEQVQEPQPEPQEPVQQPVEPQEPTQPQEPVNKDTLDKAVDTATIATETAQQKELELQQMKDALEAERQARQNLEQQMQQMSQQQEESIVDESVEMPTLDFDSLAFDDDETRQQKQAEYAQAMAKYSNAQMRKELAPLLDYAKQGLHERERNQTIDILSQVPELAGIKENARQLDNIIANNKALQNEDIPLDERYIMAYAIAKGVNAMNTPHAQPHQPTTDELMQIYASNPDFQQAVEKQRLDAIKQSQQVPPMSASTGAVNASLDIKEKPSSLEEARKRTLAMFGKN